MKKILMLIMSLLLVSSAFAVGEVTDKLVQQNIGDYNYVSSDIDKLEGDINYQYIALYERYDGEVRVDIYELYQAEDAKELFSEALNDGRLVDVTNKQVGLNTDVNHNLFWNSGKYFVSVEFPEDVSESDVLLQTYLNKYPVDVEDSSEVSQATVLIKKNIGDYKFVSEDEDLLSSGDRSFIALYEIYGLEADVEVRVMKNSGAAESLFEQAVSDESMQIVTVKNFKVAKHIKETASGSKYEYLWHSGNKIIIMSRLQWGLINNDLLVLEYLSKYPSEAQVSVTTETPVEETPVTTVPIVEDVEISEPPVPQELPAGSDCVGCEVQDNCLNLGFRLVSDNVPMYCDADSQLHAQKEEGAFCQNNFECSSNQCSNSKCIDLSGQLEETQSLLQKILAWFTRLFG